MPAVLDHLVLTVPDLEAAVVGFERRTGVRPVPGGSHPGRGTRNALVGLTWQGSHRHYLELLARDPAQPEVTQEEVLLGAGPALATGRVQMFGWAVRTTPDEFGATLSWAEAAGIDVGRPVSAARETPAGLRLSWQLAVPDPLGLCGVQPFLIAWEDAHPTDAGLPTVKLESLSLQHPEPERARTVLAMLGVEHEVEHGAVPRVQAVLTTPRSEVVLG